MAVQVVAGEDGLHQAQHGFGGGAIDQSKRSVLSMHSPCWLCFFSQCKCMKDLTFLHFRLFPHRLARQLRLRQQPIAKGLDFRAVVVARADDQPIRKRRLQPGVG